MYNIVNVKYRFVEEKMETKKILGTWFEFEHHSSIEGKYWNQQLYDFSEQDWRAKIDEIKDLGMEYIVLLATSLNNEAYFDTSIYPKSNHKTSDLIKVLLDQAEKRDLKVFLSVGYYGNWRDTYNNMTDDDVTKRAFQAIRELQESFGSFKSFYGWYLPDETQISPYFQDAFMNYVNKYSDYIHNLDKTKKLLIAPYGTNMLKADEHYVEQLKNLKVDFIAYQDEVGVQKSTTSETKEFYRLLKAAHDKANGPALWADVEIFEFEGAVYQSPLLPASFDRVREQIKQVTPYVDVILIYQYIGLMNPANSNNVLGNKEKSIKLYNDYKLFIENKK